MVSFLSLYGGLLHRVLKLAGMRRRVVEIEPGTVVNIWVTTHVTTKQIVVFLQPFASDGILSWHFQVLALAKNYAVYIPDFLFFGGSTTDKQQRSPEFQAECMAQCLRKLGVQKCTLVGLSYGGMVGFKMAHMYPDLVETLVVSGAVISLTESISNATLERIGRTSWPEFLLPATVEGVKFLFRVGTYKFPTMPNCLCRDSLKTMFGNRRERTELLDALVVSDKKFTIPHYGQKIHLLWGAEDKIFDMVTARNLERQIGEKAQLHVIEKAGHLPQLERPFTFNFYLKQILGSTQEENRHQN